LDWTSALSCPEPHCLLFCQPRVDHPVLHSFPTRRSSDLAHFKGRATINGEGKSGFQSSFHECLHIERIKTQVDIAQIPPAAAFHKEITLSLCELYQFNLDVSEKFIECSAWFLGFPKQYPPYFLFPAIQIFKIREYSGFIVHCLIYSQYITVKFERLLHITYPDYRTKYSAGMIRFF